MAIVSKTYRDGLDKVVNILQNKFYPRLLGFWDASTVYTMYPRVNKNYKNDQLKPYLSLDNKDYKETLYDDRVSVNSFFIGDDVSEWEYSNQQIRREVSIVFQANLDALYSNAERIDEAFNNDVLRVLKQPNGYIVGDIQIAEGVDQVYSDFSITSEFKEKLKLDDIGKRHVVKFTFEVIYDLNCEKRVVKACADVTSSFNGSGITSTPSGGNKAIIVQTNEAIPVQTGTIINDTSSELRVEVNASGEIPVRAYITPRYSGAVSAGANDANGSVYWRKTNEIGKRTQAEDVKMMRPLFGSTHLLDTTNGPDNVFGNNYILTGTTGGYYDPTDGNYYDVSGALTTRSGAFPDDIGINHLIGYLVQMTQSGVRTWYDWCAYGLSLTQGGFTGWYLPSVTEIVYFGNWGETLGYTNNSPLNWGSGLKLLGDNYQVNNTQCMVIQSYNHITSSPKANNNKAVLIKPDVDINLIFG